jgi:hypothetical protein
MMYPEMAGTGPGQAEACSDPAPWRGQPPVDQALSIRQKPTSAYAELCELGPLPTIVLS